MAAIGIASAAQTIPLANTPADAQYSMALDRIIMVPANPDQLHFYDPVSQNDVVVELPKRKQYYAADTFQ